MYIWEGVWWLPLPEKSQRLLFRNLLYFLDPSFVNNEFHGPLLALAYTSRGEMISYKHHVDTPSAFPAASCVCSPAAYHMGHLYRGGTFLLSRVNMSYNSRRAIEQHQPMLNNYSSCNP